MENNTVLLKNISVETPWRPILRRLGYHRDANPDLPTETFIRSIADEAAIIAQPMGIYRICQLDKKDGTLIIGRHKIKSESLLKLFKNCNIVVLMAVSVGKPLCDQRDSYMKTAISKGVIMDAVASELAEAVMDSLNHIVKQLGRQKGYETTFRFSPGYKDFDLSCQTIIDDLLNLSRIGVTVTGNFILQPEKSVTAIVGWEHE
jgi:hypothetical protein